MNTAASPRPTGPSAYPPRLRGRQFAALLAAHAQADHGQGDPEGDRHQCQQAVDGLEGGVVGGVADDVPDAGRPHPDRPGGRSQQQGGAGAQASHGPMLRNPGGSGGGAPRGTGSTYREASSRPSVRAMLVFRISLVPSYSRMARTSLAQRSTPISVM